MHYSNLKSFKFIENIQLGLIESLCAIDSQKNIFNIAEFIGQFRFKVGILWPLKSFYQIKYRPFTLSFDA